jgi:hypothetical protein
MFNRGVFVRAFSKIILSLVFLVSDVSWGQSAPAAGASGGDGLAPAIVRPVLPTPTVNIETPKVIVPRVEIDTAGIEASSREDLKRTIDDSAPKEVEGEPEADPSGPAALPMARVMNSCKMRIEKLDGCNRVLAETLESVNGDIQAKKQSLGLDRELQDGMISKTVGAFTVANEAKKMSQASIAKIQLADSQCQSKYHLKTESCEQFCSNLVLHEAYQEELATAGTTAAQAPKTKEYGGHKPIMAKNVKVCLEKERKIAINIKSAKLEATRLAVDFGKTAKSIKIGAAVTAAVVGGAVMYKNHRDDKKEEARKEEIKRNYENGIIVTDKGEQLNCLTDNTYNSLECRPAMFNYCGKSANSGKAGCTAFANSYCATANASQAYCMARSAKTYCAQTGALIPQSPACEWMAARPTTCNAQPENLQCLTSATPAQLTTKCATYPSDPLCQAFRAGKVVTQPAGSSFSSEGTAVATSTGTGTTTLNGLVSGTTGATNGSTTSSSTSGTSLLGSATTPMQRMCAAGQLTNCN